MSTLHITFVVACLCLPVGVAAQPAPSVLVQTQAPRRGTLPETIEAYGTAAASSDGVASLNAQVDGKVTQVAVSLGEAVRRGQTLLVFVRGPAAASAYAQARSALDLALQEQARASRLLSQQLATRDQQAQADRAVADAQSTIDMLHAEGADLPIQDISAPFDGVVSALATGPGDRVPAGTTLLTLARRSGLTVIVGLEPSRRDRVRPGQPVRLVATDGGSLSIGRVTRVADAVNPHTRLVDAQVSSGGPLLVGAAYHALIEIGEWSGWLVPRDAVLSDERGEYLFQVAGAVAKRVAVHRAGGTLETSVVEGMLDPARAVVVSGNYQLTDGTAVRDAGAPGAKDATGKSR